MSQYLTLNWKIIETPEIGFIKKNSRISYFNTHYPQITWLFGQSTGLWSILLKGLKNVPLDYTVLYLSRGIHNWYNTFWMFLNLLFSEFLCTIITNVLLMRSEFHDLPSPKFGYNLWMTPGCCYPIWTLIALSTQSPRPCCQFSCH